MENNELFRTSPQYIKTQLEQTEQQYAVLQQQNVHTLQQFVEMQQASRNKRCNHVKIITS